ncbi:reverse transcriptase domain-containing protein [Tanacetum coccineum]
MLALVGFPFIHCDKNWTRPTLNRNSAKFKLGLNNFYERCKAHINDRGLCCCPCRLCGNRDKLTPINIKHHIHNNGFSNGYPTWVHHGEPRIIPPPIVDDTNDTINVLNDVHAAVPTKYNMEGLFEMANEELFPACTWMSSLDFLAKFAHLKVLYKWTNTSFDETIEFLLKSFLTGAKLPKSYYEAKKSMKKVRLGYESIDAYINDCCLFWGKDNKDDEICPICKASRWKNKDTTGKKAPNKHMTWHATGKCIEDGKIDHPVDGKAWKEFDKNNSEFSKEHRNPLVKELKTLWKKSGVKMLDIATNTEFSMRVVLL